MIFFQMNWYSKRLTLAGIYKSTELFMIQDKSENFRDTYQFLDNRFDDLANFSQMKNQVIYFQKF
jgi:ubiquinone biosynthesis protein COQ9